MDQCILEPEDKDGYLDDDGCPDSTTTPTASPTARTSAPTSRRTSTASRTTTAAPIPDNDGDRVADVDDYCPNTPGIPGGDKPGCPKKNTLIVVTEKEIRITQQIQFEFNKAVIKPGISFKILDEVGGVLNDNPKISLEVQGHTDNVGARRVQHEAVAVARRRRAAYLVAHGIAPDRLVVQGLRLPPAARPEQQRREPRAQPPRAVHSDRVGGAGSPPRSARPRAGRFERCRGAGDTCAPKRLRAQLLARRGLDLLYARAPPEEPTCNESLVTAMARRRLSWSASFVVCGRRRRGPTGALAADPKIEKEAQALQKKAIEEDNLNVNYPGAIKKLQSAIAKCDGDKCNSALKAALLRDLGAMQVLNGSVDEGKASFGQAIGLDAVHRPRSRVQEPAARGHLEPT